MIISFIILNFYSNKYLKDLINDLERQISYNFEILILDNSNDINEFSIVENIKNKSSLRKKIKIYNKFINLGWGKGNNFLADKSSGNILVFLNVDTKLSVNFTYLLEKKFNIFDKKIVCPRIVGEDQNINENYKLSLDFLHYPGVGKDKILYLDGSCLICSKNDFYNIGKFDELFFIYQDDVDFSLRAQIYGYKIEIMEDIIITHLLSKTFKKTKINYLRIYEVEKNTLMSIYKNFNIYNVILSLLLNIVLKLIIFLICLIINPKISFLIVKSLIFFILNFSKIHKSRNKIQSKRVINDDYYKKNMTGFLPNRLIQIYNTLKKI